MKLLGNNHPVCIEPADFAINEGVLKAGSETYGQGVCSDRTMLVRLTGVSEKAFYEALPTQCRKHFLLESPEQRARDAGVAQTDNSFNLEEWQIYVIVAFGLCSTVACLLVAVGTVVVIERKYRRGRGPVDTKLDEDGDVDDDDGAWVGSTDEDGYYDEDGNWIDNQQEESELLGGNVNDAASEDKAK